MLEHWGMEAWVGHHKLRPGVRPEVILVFGGEIAGQWGGTESCRRQHITAKLKSLRAGPPTIHDQGLKSVNGLIDWGPTRE